MIDQIGFVRVHPDAKLPARAHASDAGLDLFTCESRRVPVGGYTEVPIGVTVNLPDGYWARIVGRSSTLRNRGLLVAEGIIDCGYTGLLWLGVQNLGWDAAEVLAGERIAQLILHRNELLTPVWAGKAKRSSRGERGFGSTGR